MRKPIIAIILILCLLSGLTGCGNAERRYDAEDYVLELAYKDDFRVLQLNDIHLGNKDNRRLHYDFLTLTVNDAKPDMIIADGDVFTFADKTTAKEVFAFLDSFGVPWTVTFGNHDEQCYFSIDWMTGYLNDYGSNCVFRDLQDDDVNGNSNFAINLTKDGSAVAQIIVMDSNRYNYGEYWGYDYIKPDQIDWYTRIVSDTTARNNGTAVPSILFFHIPFPEFDDAALAAEAGEPDAVRKTGVYGEPASAPEINTGFFDVIRSLGSTKAVCVAHDHLNDFQILYKGVYLCYGVNSTNRIYYDEALMGGAVTVIHPDGTLDFEQYFHTYDELEGGAE